MDGHGSCSECGRECSSPLGLQMHSVRVHHRRLDADASAPSATRPADETVPPRDASPDESDGPLEPDGGGRPDPSPEVEPPAEDSVVREVADGLPSPSGILMIGSDRLGRVRGLLASARRKAGRDPEATDEGVVRKFWDSSDRRILNDLRARGVSFRARTVGAGDRGG